MKIFIPKNLTNIEIISQLKKMIDGYVDYYEKSNESFDNYYYLLKNFVLNSFLLSYFKREIYYPHPSLNTSYVITLLPNVNA